MIMTLKYTIMGNYLQFIIIIKLSSKAVYSYTNIKRYINMLMQ